MLDYLSPREYEEVRESERRGQGWARVVRLFLDGPRLRLGWDVALCEDEIGRLARLGDSGTARAAIDAAVRWAVEHRLHLLGWQEPDDTWRYFMAVG